MSSSSSCRRSVRVCDRGSSDNDGQEGTQKPPKKGGDSDAPPRRKGEKLGEDGLTDAQRAHFRDRIDNAPNQKAADQARYDRNCTKRDNAGDRHMKPADWQESNNRLRDNAGRGGEQEAASLKALGVENNNTRPSPDTYDTPDGQKTRPDGTTDSSVVDVKSMPDSPDPERGPRVLHNSDQLRGQAQNSDGKLPVVVMTNGNKDNCRPSGPLAEQSTVLHRDSSTGRWSQWDPDSGTWKPTTQSAAQDGVNNGFP